ncbi:hypothetical protein ANN_06792 [Periplaneta americana]|uniref:Uncharacterized protein n=1 Tax=Periplaneta americana TaxID=6978 RepID=A0ABQ8TGC9_PERAM|nr:hypothetical protein ANN_06792 [Periplaneta americana]
MLPNELSAFSDVSFVSLPLESFELQTETWRRVPEHYVLRLKQRALIEFSTAQNVPPTDIHRRLKAVYRDQCVDISTVRRCTVRWVKCGYSETNFSNRYSRWLDHDITLPTENISSVSTPKKHTDIPSTSGKLGRGRPTKVFGELSERSKRRKAKETRENVSSEELSYATVMSLRASIVKSALLPIGVLSEEAMESLNKTVRRFRQDHARKTSRITTNCDLFHRLFLASDPLISNLRELPKKKRTRYHCKCSSYSVHLKGSTARTREILILKTSDGGGVRYRWHSGRPRNATDDAYRNSVNELIIANRRINPMWHIKGACASDNCRTGIQENFRTMGASNAPSSHEIEEIGHLPTIASAPRTDRR